MSEDSSLFVRASALILRAETKEKADIVMMIGSRRYCH